jgi:hypothetical protein
MTPVEEAEVRKLVDGIAVRLPIRRPSKENARITYRPAATMDWHVTYGFLRRRFRTLDEACDWAFETVGRQRAREESARQRLHKVRQA